MDVARKTDLAKSQIRSISQHDDEDSIVRGRALDTLVAFIEEERAAMTDRANARIDAIFNEKKAPAGDVEGA